MWSPSLCLPVAGEVTPNSLAKHLWIPPKLLLERVVIANGDHPIAAVPELFSQLLIPPALLGGVVLRAVDEYTDARQAIAFVVKVGLDRQVGVGPVLRLVGQPELVLVQVLEEGPL